MLSFYHITAKIFHKVNLAVSVHKNIQLSRLTL